MLCLPNPQRLIETSLPKQRWLVEMDSLELLEQGISLIMAAPVTSGTLVAIGAVVAWMLARMVGQHRLTALQRQLESREDNKVLIEERLAAVMRNEDMLTAQVAALQEHFQIVQNQVLHEGRVPALIAATGSTASTISNIALTAEALNGSLSVLRVGVGGNNNIRLQPPRMNEPRLTHQPDAAVAA
jgi:hypothetical protein